MKREFSSAFERGLVSCGACHLLSRWPGGTSGTRAVCPRCGSELHQRKPNSIGRTWALLLTSMLLYIPANLLPMTLTSKFGRTQADTIMSGIVYFIHNGSWGIALVVFSASVFVPLTKFLILIYLLLSVQFKLVWRPRDRTLLYRAIEAVGRWSMVDIFVVTITVALVKLGVVANVAAGPAAIYFAFVVVVSMLATRSFDPRLIWDVVEEKV